MNIKFDVAAPTLRRALGISRNRADILQKGLIGLGIGVSNKEEIAMVNNTLKNTNLTDEERIYIFIMME